MAITFDPANKIIQLDSFQASEKEIWTAMVDWAVLSDNLKYGVGMLQIGGVAPIALYLYLDLGWRVRPLEADGITTIKGNLLVEGGGSPITPVLGNFNSLVNMETPVQAVAIEVNTGSGVTEQDKLDIADRVWDEVMTEHLTAGSTGEKLDTGGGSDVNAIWDELTANHQIAGSTGKALTDAGAAGNPWSSSLLGNNTVGTFGYLLQTTFIGYFNSIISQVNRLFSNTFSKTKQPNQK